MTQEHKVVTSAKQLAARQLREAYSGKVLQPMRHVLDPVDVDGAYEVQAINTRHWIECGRRIIGRKIGLTAKSVQQQLGVDRPDFGVLFADMRIADGGELSSSRTIQPKAEAEVALVMARDLDNHEAAPEDVLSAVEYVVPAIEIVDSRIADWKITFADTVADNGSSAFFVLGLDSKPPVGLDLYTCGMALEVNGQLASMGAGAACLGHPLNAAAWLARTLALRREPLRAGDIVLTGALGPMVSLIPGSHVRALIGGLGSVTFNFEGAQT